MCAQRGKADLSLVTNKEEKGVRKRESRKDLGLGETDLSTGIPKSLDNAVT